MPATYTYNDAIDDAKMALMEAWEEKFSEAEPEKYMPIILNIVGRLEQLKRPSRRRRPKLPQPLGAGQ